ncbi:MAG: hypothetical protein CL881_09030 [Dehalococcoidia bacterium]|jgi:hypothetical protein|nr:hypothetical protein [Dehalococcoidia bacterium]
MLPLLTSQKVAIPATLFLALSPGMLLKTNGSNISFKNVSTDRMSVFFHGLVFFLVYSVVAKSMGLVLTRNDLLVSTTLFLALSPGMLLTIPPGEVMSGKTSRPAILTHAVVFAVVFALLRKQFPQFY